MQCKYSQSRLHSYYQEEKKYKPLNGRGRYLQDPGEGLPILIERPLVFGAGGVVVVGHLGKLLLRDGLVLHDVGDLPHGASSSPPAGEPPATPLAARRKRKLERELCFCWIQFISSQENKAKLHLNGDGRRAM